MCLAVCWWRDLCSRENLGSVLDKDRSRLRTQAEIDDVAAVEIFGRGRNDRERARGTLRFDLFLDPEFPLLEVADGERFPRP